MQFYFSHFAVVDPVLPYQWFLSLSLFRMVEQHQDKASQKKQQKRKRNVIPWTLGRSPGKAPFCLFFSTNRGGGWRVPKKQISISCMTANLFLDVWEFTSLESSLFFQPLFGIFLNYLMQYAKCSDVQKNAFVARLIAMTPV